MASKTPFSTLIEPSETQESRGQSIKPGGYNGNDFMPIHRNAVTRAILGTLLPLPPGAIKFCHRGMLTKW
jgi:hypothetical protein